jgi:hypothetical protein
MHFKKFNHTRSMKSTIQINIIAFILLLSSALHSQIQRDQDLVTLKNGYQILGHIIEQQPGKLIKIYRPEMNDTIETKLEDVTKLNKILVQSFSEKKVETLDSIQFGRYNNKKHVFMASYVVQVRDIEQHERKGVGLAYFHNFNNQYWGGVSSSIFRRQNPKPSFGDVRSANADFSLSQVQLMFENKLRLSMRQQNKRLTTMLAVNVGYIFDQSRNSFDQTKDPLDAEYEDFSNGFAFQTGIAFRINPDNNSGFLIEPGFTYYAQHVKEYSGHPDGSETVYLGFHRQANSLFTLKLGYFF